MKKNKLLHFLEVELSKIEKQISIAECYGRYSELYDLNIQKRIYESEIKKLQKV